MLVLIGFASGCASSIPEEAFRLPPSSLGAREAQTRAFEVSDDVEILQASVALLQDMEYNIDTIEYPLGLMSASKVVDADSAVQKARLVAADIALTILAALTGSTPGSAYAGADDEVGLTITLVVQPSLAREGQHTARITLQSTLIDKAKRVKKVDVIEDPIVYQQIFEKLSTSLVLEGVEQ